MNFYYQSSKALLAILGIVIPTFFSFGLTNLTALEKSPSLNKPQPKKVITRILKERFPGSSVRNIDTTSRVDGKTNYLVRFAFKGKERQAEFGENGYIRKTDKIDLDASDLSDASRAIVNNNFPKSNFEFIQTWIHDDMMFYFIRLQSGGCRYELEFHNDTLYKIASIELLDNSKIKQLPEINRPFFEVVKAFADTMLRDAIDTYGPKQGALFVALLDRKTHRPPDIKLLPLPLVGVTADERLLPLTSNIKDQTDLLLLFQQLGEITGDRKYSYAFDAAIQFMLVNCTYPYSGLFSWGGQDYYDLLTDKIVGDTQVFETNWPFWDRAFFLNRDAMVKMANGLWQVGLREKETGASSRKSRILASENPFNINMGSWNTSYMVDLWSRTYQKTSNRAFLKYIELMLPQLEKRIHPQYKFYRNNIANDNSLIVHTGCPYLWEASLRLPEPMRSRLKKMANEADSAFVALPHDVTQKGFITNIEIEEDNVKYTYSGIQLWQNGSSLNRISGAISALGNILNQRLLQLPQGPVRQQMSEWVVQIADLYQTHEVTFTQPVIAFTLADAILLQLNAFRLTQQRKYLDYAHRLGKKAVDVYWGVYGLPAASSFDDHYESIAGGARLARALLELNLALQ